MGMVLLPAASFHPHLHHHHHHHETLMSSADHPIIPLLTAAPCLIDEDNSASAAAARAKAAAGIQIWQPAQPQPHHHLLHHYPPPSHNPNPSPTLSYLKKPMPMLDSSGLLAAVGAPGGSAGGMIGGAMTCQDCGNQAKKDCSHRRCRTCCKSRGLDCSTHVKSTWVPAARRRERQQLATAAAGSSASTSASKKPRLVTSQAAATTTTTSHTSTSNNTPRSFDTSSSQHQDADFRDSLPGHVRAPAVFKCVRVTSVDDGEDEYAYHALVKIGGHVFKGFLYDQGLEDSQAATTSNGNNAAGGNAIPNISELHLGGRNGSGGGASSSSPMLAPSDVFGGALGGSSGLIGGPNFGNQIN